MPSDKRTKGKAERTEVQKPTQTFTYFDQSTKDESKTDNTKETLNLPTDTDWRKVNGNKSTNARVWSDTLNRVNALITMQHFESFNEFVMSMLDEYEDRLDENDYKYQELIIRMYNNKK